MLIAYLISLMIQGNFRYNSQFMEIKIIRFFLFSILALMYVFTSAQNIGIGTSSPAFKLDIAGRIRVKTGTLGNVSTSSGMWLEDFRNGTNRMFIGMQDSIRSGFYGSGGVGWGFNFNAMSGDVDIVTGSLGIGTESPTFDIYINRNLPGIGFNDTGNSHFSGSIVGDSADLLLNAYRKSAVGSEDAGDLLLQVNTTGLPNLLAGKVGIGTYTPSEKLHIVGNLKLQGTSTEVILSSNSTTDKGIVHLSGNDLEIGTATGNSAGRVVISTNNTDQIAVTSTGEMNRLSQTGTADILPIAYARVNSAGTILSGAGVQSVTKIADGNFNIRISGETISANPNAYSVIVTPVVGGADDFTFPSIRVRFIGDDLKIELGNYNLVYQNHGDCGCPQDESNTFVTAQGYTNANSGFSFVVYKQ